MPHQINHNLDPFLPKPGGNIDAKSTMPALGTLSSVAGTASNIAGTIGKAGKVAGAAGKAAGAINPVGLAMMGLDMGIKGFTAGKAAKDAGASTGGAVLEGVLGTVGLEGLYEDPAIKAARKAEQTKQAGIASASNQLTKNTMEMQKEDYSNMNEDGTMATKYGVVKKLGAITGTMSPNMSMAQYNDERKFSKIAKNLPKINEIKTNTNFATKGTEFKDTSGTNNQVTAIAFNLADKDYDGDGKLESSKEEYFGSKGNAIKENNKNN